MKKNQLKHILSDFMEKMRFKFRISITNENTLEETWYTRLSRLNVVLFLTGIFLLTFILLTLLIYTTPLRNYLPGYGDSGNRTAIVQQSIRADSLQHQVELMNAYLQVLKENIVGNPDVDSIQTFDSDTLKKRATEFIAKSKREARFVKQYEEVEKYNLETLNASDYRAEKEVPFFFQPVSGVVASTFDPEKENFGISIITSGEETVKSVSEGRVIFTGFTFDNEWVIIIQNDDDYISIYKNNIRLLKKTGEFVKAGESIAITGNEGNTETNRHFYFELWKKGVPVNSQEVITFRL